MKGDSMDYIAVYNEWLSKVTAEERAELISIGGNDKEIKERFSLPLEFGTAGMRGTIALGTFRMNEYTVRRATKGLADYILSLGAEAMRAGVVVSYDTRRFSYEFALAAARVLAYYKINSYLFEDVRPVPMCSFAVRFEGAAAGIMITASHNPKEYNGYKVYGPDGAQMSPEATAEVVRYIDAVEDYFSVPEASVNVKSRSEVQGADGKKLNEYITVIGESVDKEYFKELSLLALSPDAVKRQAKNIKIVYTPIHGAGYKPVTRILGQMGIPVFTVKEQTMPDPDFSTVSAPNPENEDALRLAIKLAKETGSGVVIGTDPDSDRMGIALKGNDGGYFLLTGNQIGALLLDYICRRKKETNTLPANAAAVKTIVTTSLAARIAESYGVEIFDVLTGFKFIGEKIKEWEADGSHTFVFGYEESFGYLSGTHSRDKDAVVASMLFAEMTAYYLDKRSSVQERLQELYEEFGYFYEKNVATTYKGLDGMERMASIMANLSERKIDEIAGYKVAFKDDYNTSLRMYSDGREQVITLPKSNVLYYGLSGGDWVCVRPSGTEPKLKVYVSTSGESASASEEKGKACLQFMSALL